MLYSAIILVAAIALTGYLDDILGGLSSGTGSLFTTPEWQTYVTNYACCQGPGCAIERKRPCHIELSTDFLQFLYETAKMNALTSLINHQFFAFLGNMSMGISFLVLDIQAGLSVMPFAGLNGAADFFSLLFDLAVKTMLLLRAQQFFLDFLNYPLFSVFLAMGLILRIFYFARKLGGLLVALAISFYVIFPMFYVVTYAILWSFLGPWVPIGTSGLPQPYGADFDATSYYTPFSDGTTLTEFQETESLKDVVGNPEDQVTFDICNSVEDFGLPQSVRDAAQADRTDYDNTLVNFRNKWEQIEGSKWYTVYSDMLKYGAGIGLFDMEGPIGALASVLTLTLFVPFLALMTTLACVKVMSPMLGGDVEISVLSRVI